MGWSLRHGGVVASFSDRAARRLPEFVTVAELRLDTFGRCDAVGAARVVASWRAACPTLVTARRCSDGGSWTGSERDRVALLTAIVAHADAVDVEIGSVAATELTASRPDRCELLASLHDLAGTPPLEQLAELVDSVAEDVAAVKVATTVRTPRDLDVLARLAGRRCAAPVSVMGMGPLGAQARRAAVLAGAPLVYVCDGDVSVPGQLDAATVAELRHQVRCS